MAKKKNAALVSLTYSDSENEDDTFAEDEEEVDNSPDEDLSNALNEKEIVENVPEIFFEDVYGDHQFSAEEFHKKLFDSQTGEPEVPPRSKRECPEELEAQIEHYNKKVKMGLDFIKTIQDRKSLRNPSIYEKMISYCQINEMATNYPKNNYDPEPFLKPESYYEELARLQKEMIEKHEREKKSTPNKSSSSNASADKKSKWDSVQSNNNSAAIAAALARVHNIVQQASSNKPTVISAFGTITKKK